MGASVGVATAAGPPPPPLYVSRGSAAYAAPPPPPAYAAPPPAPAYAAPPPPPHVATAPAYVAPGAPPGPLPRGVPFGSPGYGGWSLREMEQWQNLARVANTALGSANAACGSSMGGAFVFETFRGRFSPNEDFGAANLRGHVEAPMNALATICQQGAMQRERVQRGVGRIDIRWSDVGNSTFQAGGGVLTAFVAPRGHDSSYYAGDLLQGLPRVL